jgi:hypothetical protein
MGNSRKEGGLLMDEIIQTLTKMKNDTALIISKLEEIRKEFKYYKNAAEAFDRAITNFIEKQNGKKIS